MPPVCQQGNVKAVTRVTRTEQSWRVVVNHDGTTEVLQHEHSEEQDHAVANRAELHLAHESLEVGKKTSLVARELALLVDDNLRHGHLLR